MGFISGDNIGTITVGKDVTATSSLPAYDAPGGSVVDTIPAGTYLGICNNVQDSTLFFFGNWWLSFPAPSEPIGNVSGAFWIKYDASVINVGGAPPADNSGFNGLPEGLQNLFGSLENMIVFLVIIVALLAGLVIFLKYRK